MAGSYIFLPFTDKQRLNIFSNNHFHFLINLCIGEGEGKGKSTMKLWWLEQKVNSYNRSTRESRVVFNNLLDTSGLILNK